MLDPPPSGNLEVRLPAHGPADAGVQTILELLRAHLSFDVVLISAPTGDDHVIRHVVAEGCCNIMPGLRLPADQTLCAHVAEGRAPALVRDARTHPVTSSLDATHLLNIATYLAVPIILSDGTLHGVLAGYSHTRRADLDRRDVALTRMMAAVLADRVDAVEVHRRHWELRTAQLRELKAGRDLKLVFQPIVDLTTGQTAGLEALSRFPSFRHPPDEVFDEAWRLGVGLELELEVVEYALLALARLDSDMCLAINVAPETLSTPQLARLLEPHDAARVMFEVTERAAITDYPAVASGSRRVRDLGAKLAVDDVGAGISGLEHILRLTPDVLKLDGELVRGIEACHAKRAMVEALGAYAARTGTDIVAERVETSAERDVLMELGVPFAQGFLFGKPTRLDDVASRTIAPV